MPIYEYKAVNGVCCRLCRGRFEVRQGINDEPVQTCPDCGAAVTKLYSLPFLPRGESLNDEEAFGRYEGDEFDELGLEDDLAGGEGWR